MLHLTAALDPASQVPLYEQLYRSIAQEISAGALPAGARMPGKRSLAEALSVSVNTVDGAYQMLAAEGYLASRPRSGFYVQEYPARPVLTGETNRPPELPAAPAPEGPPVQYDLSTSGVDTRLFPARTWARLQKELLYTSPGLLARGDPQGEMELRQALAGYLEEYRGVRCAPEQIIVGAGIEHLLSLLAPLLPGPAAVEDPGYPRARQVLENSGRPCRFVPVDEGGLSVAALAASDAAVCYVTPSHQFPTGVTMPAPRRAELLGWAARRPGQRYIIEDDYDSEFRFDTRPLPSLQGMAGADGPVVYLSTVARSLAPGIRIAYMVLPAHLLPAWRQRYSLYSGTALSSRPWPASSGRGILPATWPAAGWPTRPGGPLWPPRWRMHSARRRPCRGCTPASICCCGCAGKTSRPTRRWRPPPGRPASACRPSAATTWMARRPARRGHWCWGTARWTTRSAPRWRRRCPTH